MPPLPPSRAPGAVGAPDDSLVVSALWRAIRVLRPLALVYAAWTAWTRRDEMQQPTAAFAILGVLAVWTVVALVWERHELWWHVIELGLAAGAVVATRWVDTPDAVFRGTTTLPGVWQAVPVASIGIVKGWRGGLAAGGVIAVVVVASTRSVEVAAVSNGLLVLLVGGTVGYCADLVRAEQVELSRALAQEAEDVERDRLARTTPARARPPRRS